MDSSKTLNESQWLDVRRRDEGFEATACPLDKNGMVRTFPKHYVAFENPDNARNPIVHNTKMPTAPICSFTSAGQTPVSEAEVTAIFTST